MHLIDVLLLEISVLEHLLDGLHSLAEQVHVELLELGASEGLREVVTVLEGFNLEVGGLLAGKSALGLLYFALKLTEGLEVARDVGTGLLLVLLDEVIDGPVVEVLTTEVSIPGSCQDLENAVVDGKERDIEGSTTKVVDDDLELAILGLLIKTVGDGSGSRLVDDTEDGEARWCRHPW